MRFSKSQFNHTVRNGAKDLVSYIDKGGRFFARIRHNKQTNEYITDIFDRKSVDENGQTKIYEYDINDNETDAKRYAEKTIKQATIFFRNGINRNGISDYDFLKGRIRNAFEGGFYINEIIPAMKQGSNAFNDTDIKRALKAVIKEIRQDSFLYTTEQNQTLEKQILGKNDENWFASRGIRRNGAKRNGLFDSDNLIEDTDEEYLAARLEPYYQDTTDLDELTEMFHGERIQNETELLAAKICPRFVGRLGYLEYLILENGDRIEFEDLKSFAAMDRRKNVWLVGGGAVLNDYEKPPFNEFGTVGKVYEISYRTGKAHIGNRKTISFYHNFGEVDSTLPTLLIDDEGFPVLVGGNYTIKKEGIIN